MNHCIWAKYIHSLSDMDELKQFITDNNIGNRFRIHASSIEFVNDIKEACNYIEQEVNKNHILWVALFI